VRAVVAGLGFPPADGTPDVVRGVEVIRRAEPIDLDTAVQAAAGDTRAIGVIDSWRSADGGLTVDVWRDASDAPRKIAVPVPLDGQVVVVFVELFDIARGAPISAPSPGEVGAVLSR
jgi:hypothetical protein